MIGPVVVGHTCPAPAGKWQSLEALRCDALAKGCTPAQFTYAAETFGPHIEDVAVFLHRQGFMREA